MKSATDPAESSQTVQTTVTKRVLPDAQPRERTTPEFWFYIESMKPDDWEDPIRPGMVYIYRTDPRASNYGDGQSCIDKCPGYIEMSGESVRRGWPQRVPFDNREDVELAIGEKHGGRAFRLILKRGRERITEGKAVVDAPPKFQSAPPQDSGGPTVTAANEMSSTAQVANKAIDTMASQEQKAVSVGIEALNAAASVVQRFSQATDRAQPSAVDDAMKQTMAVMLQRALNPPDPLDQLTKLLTLMNTLRPGGAPTSENPIVNKILDAGLERVLNPPVAPSNNPTMGTELVRHLPNVVREIGDVMREWRGGMEAQRDATALARGMQPPPGAPPRLPVAGAPAPPAPPAPNAATPEGDAMVPPLEWVEAKIVEILRKPISADEAADEAVAFLVVAHPQLGEQLAAATKEQLLAVFASRPILKQIPAGPRLVEFIDAFLKYAAGEEPPAASPAAVKPN